jgi:hypothetical protein
MQSFQMYQDGLRKGSKTLTTKEQQKTEVNKIC